MPRLRNRGRSDERRLPPSAVAGSVTVHVALVAFVLLVGPAIPSAIPPRTFRVRLVAAADQRAPERQDPAPARVAEEEHRPPPPQPEVERQPETETPAVVREEPPVERPEREPARASEEGEETVNVQLDGAIFPFPSYLNNIIRQVERYWRPPADSRALRAELVFVILEDGSVTEIEWIRRSSDPVFDLQAKGAIEAAGRHQAFGPLPDGYPRDRLRVSFFFDPSRR